MPLCHINFLFVLCTVFRNIRNQMFEKITNCPPLPTTNHLIAYVHRYWKYYSYRMVIKFRKNMYPKTREKKGKEKTQWGGGGGRTYIYWVYRDVPPVRVYVLRTCSLRVYFFANFSCLCSPRYAFSL